MYSTTKYYFYTSIILLLYSLSCIDMVSAICSRYEAAIYQCKAYYTILNGNSTSKMIVSTDDRVEFHYVRLQYKEKGKVLRLRWISLSVGSTKNRFKLRIG